MFGGLAWFLIGLALLPILIFFTIRDNNYCIIYPEGTNSTVIRQQLPLLGYYRANENYFNKIGDSGNVFPDVFGLYQFRRDISWDNVIRRGEDSWRVFSEGGDVIYTPQTSKNPVMQKPFKYVVPEGVWVSEKDISKRIVVHCQGQLTGESALFPQGHSNLEYLFYHPITTLLLLIISGYSYYLFDKRVEVSAVSFSYNAFVQERQYWRAITASFAHFDVMHFGFNTMSIFQLAALESLYGSLLFGYLSFALIFITILICSLVSYFLIQQGRTDYIHAQSVGYSCVLFAWMVVISVRMPKFCPITFVPQLCFQTFEPLAFIGIYIPLNIGPFVLLIITKLIIPRSSFMGHLSGIIIGFPLAWDLLDWLNPVLLFAFFVLFVMYDFGISSEKLLHGYQSYSNFAEFVEAVELTKFKTFCCLAVLTAALSFAHIWFGMEEFFSVGAFHFEVFIRGLFVYLLYLFGQARVTLWYADARNPSTLCVVTALLALASSAVLCIYDLSSAVAFAIAVSESWFGFAHYWNGHRTLVYVWVVLSIAELLLAIVLVFITCDVSQAVPYAKIFRLDDENVLADMDRLLLTQPLRWAGLLRQSTMSRFAFSGVASRLNNSRADAADVESQQSLLLPSTTVAAPASSIQLIAAAIPAEVAPDTTSTTSASTVPTATHADVLMARINRYGSNNNNSSNGKSAVGNTNKSLSSKK